MTREECVELAHGDDELLFVDGHDDAIMGVCTRFGQEPIVAYNERIVIQELVSQGMTCEEAYEYFNFNIIGAWMGDRTPCFFMIGDM